LDVPKLAPAPDNSPERLETGTQNHEGMIGAAAAVDFLASLAVGPSSRRGSLMRTFSDLHARGELLLERMWNGLSALDGVTVFGPPPGTPRTPTISFALHTRTTDDIAARLADRGVFVSNGDFYAATVIERLGRARDGVVRAGCSCYTTADEVD